MYSDHLQSAKNRWIRLLAVLVLAAAIGILIHQRPDRDLSEESTAAIQAAVERSALQCYVVEGIYPPDLNYLEDNYGLQINTKDFYVTYDAFASNVAPHVIVRAK